MKEIEAKIRQEETKLEELPSKDGIQRKLSKDLNDGENWEEQFATHNTPLLIRKALIQAKRKKKQKIQKKQTEDKPEKVETEVKKENGQESPVNNPLEDELFELTDKAMDTAEGKGETIVFNPEEIVNPFDELLEGKEQNNEEDQLDLNDG